MPNFCNAFNDATKDRKGDIVPVVITAYEDKSFDFVLKLLQQRIYYWRRSESQKVQAIAKTVKVGSIDQAKLKEIAEYKCLT